MNGLIFIGMIEPDSHNHEERGFVDALSAYFDITHYRRGVGIKGLRPHQLRSLPDRLRNHSPVGRLRCGALLITPFRTLLRGPNTRWLARQLQRLVADRRVEWTLWIRFPSPELVGAIVGLRLQAIVYEPIDLYTASADLSHNEAAHLAAAESQLIQRSAVITGGRLLAQRFSAASCGSTWLPFGLDLTRPDSGDGIPPSIRHPRIGIVGCLDWRVDEELLVSVAIAHPEWQLVLAGPRAGSWGRRLARFRNVHWLGCIPFDRVPAVIRHLDVTLIPYRLVDWTRHCLPVKVFEYLAEGKPVIATPLPELALFGETVSVAQPASFISAIERVLQRDHPEQADARRRIALGFTVADRARGAVAVLRGSHLEAVSQ